MPGLSGKQVVGEVVWREIANRPPDYCNAYIDPRANYPVLPSATLNNYAWSTVGKTNPSVGNLQVPTMIGELKDVPHLVRTWGEGLLHRMANANLWWKFGIRPMISDIRKLHQYVKETNSLFRAMRKLANDGYITRRCNLEQSSTNETIMHDGLINSSAACHVHGTRYVRHTSKVWGSCRWKTTSGFNPPVADEALEREIGRILYGFNLEGGIAMVWELIPWSWLVDWFIDVQGFLGTVNTIGLAQDGICIMRTISSKSRYVLDTSPQTVYNVDFEIKGQYYELGIRKERYPNAITGAPTASIPALGAGQWSILGSLAALRSSTLRAPLH
jgi:hypothetical protein